jgi:hypothetical protein|tara:strand:+ start:123 stop:362 length:240 start_codon:yes stop_codon:yes gene_type:complete
MVIENLTGLVVDTPGLIEGASSLAKAIWALGGAIIFYVIFGITNIFLNRNRNKKIEEVLKKIDKLDRKVGNLKKSGNKK